MQVSDILTNETSQELQIIKERCSNFLFESDALPLYKNLPVVYSDFRRVKVRHRKVDVLGEAMNTAFRTKDRRLAQRAIFASGNYERVHESLEPFYIFPIDGYHYIYNKNVRDSFDVNPIIEEFGEEKGIEALVDVMKLSYTSKHLSEGIQAGSEIILYGIPFYYALRSSIVENYETLLTAVLES